MPQRPRRSSRPIELRGHVKREIRRRNARPGLIPSKSKRKKRKSVERGWHVSSKTGKNEFYESSYERIRMEFLDSQPTVVSWTKHHGVLIRYKSFRRLRTYVPDLLVEYADGRRVLEEIKGRVFDRPVFDQKNSAARAWCKARDMQFRLIFKHDLYSVS